MAKDKKLQLFSTKADTKPKQEFSGSAAKGKSLPEKPKSKSEFGGGKY